MTETEAARLPVEQRVEERTRELSTLLEVSRCVASTLELDPLLDLVLGQLKLVADYAGASLCIIDGVNLRFQLSRGATPMDREDGAIGLRLALAGGGVIWEAIRRREAVIIADVRGDDPLAQAYRAWLAGE